MMFFFFKQKTAYEMRISDWSSDVCSSDLIGTPDQFGDRANAELRHPLPRFLGDEAEVVHHHFRQADEIFLAQHAVLRGDPGCAVVEMADAQILAAERDHRRSAEAERFGNENRRLDDVEAGLEAAVGLHADLVAQVVRSEEHTSEL